MSFGFGLGLPHYVAVLGGSGSGYFLSLTIQTLGGCGGGGLLPASIFVDASGNISIFGRITYVDGYNDTNAFAVKLTPSGALSITKYLSPTVDTGIAVQDSAGYYYVVAEGLQSCACRNPELIKLDSSFNKVTGTLLQDGGVTQPITAPIIDSSGNFWFLYNSGPYPYLQKVSSNFATSSIYGGACFGCDFVAYNSVAATPSGTSFILTGDFQHYICCVCCGNYYIYHPVLQASTFASPTINTWSGGLLGDFANGFGALAVSSAGNIYVGFTNYLLKFNSSGVIQWQYVFTDVYDIKCITFDSSGNVYFAALDASTSGVVIIKLTDSGSTASMQYARKLNSAGNGMRFAYNKYTNALVIKDTALYLTVGMLNGNPSPANKAIVFKAPTDGTLTQTISVGGNFILYAAALGVTQTPGTLSVSSPGYTNYPLSGPATATSQVPGNTTLSTLAATNAVTVL